MLAQCAEQRVTAREQLVRVGLVPHVPDNFIFGCIKYIMQGDRQFDGPQAGSQMTAGL